MSEDLPALARSIALAYYEDAFPGHDRYHAVRVRDLSVRLAGLLQESVATDVLAAAAWLHDIGRPRERTGAIDDHDRWGAREATSQLRSAGVDPARIEAIGECIRSHSIRATSPDPTTPEARVLFDADKLDAIGAVGIVRLSSIVGERSCRAGKAYASLDDATAHSIDRPDRPDVSLLEQWARERLHALHTQPARQIGASRWDFVESFFEQFTAEIGTDGTR